MTPRLADRAREIDCSGVDASRETGQWRWFAIGLFAAGFATGLVLVVVGSPRPTMVPVVVLAAFVGIAVNRYALFPTELAVTAEAAVLVAAVVFFAVPLSPVGGASPLLGPWCVALLAGLLDLAHWRRRSFVRMAYNAGNRMIAALVGAAAFASVIHVARSSSLVILACAALSASLAFALVEGVIGTVLVRLRSREPWRVAARTELWLDVLTIPLGVAGAGAAYLGHETEWWSAAVVLAATLFVPELVLVPVRQLRPFRRVAATIGPAATVLIVLGLLVPFPDPSVLAGLVVLAFAMGVELRVDPERPAPPLVAMLVVAAAVVCVDREIVAAIVVAVIATATACLTSRVAVWWAPVLAGAAAGAAVAVYDVRPTRAGALAAGLAFGFLVGVRWERVVWTAPMVCAASSLAFAWRAVGPLGAALFATGLVALLVASAACGAPPWGSRVVGPWAARHASRVQRTVLVATVVCSLGLGFAASATTIAREALASGAAAAAAMVAAMAMVGVRQWRFAPRGRMRDAALALASAVIVVVVYPPLALAGEVWSPVILIATVAVCARISWPLARLGSLAAPCSERVW
jgi:hypothetical protein